MCAHIITFGNKISRSCTIADTQFVNDTNEISLDAHLRRNHELWTSRHYTFRIRPRDATYRLNQQFFHEVNPLLSGQILTFLSNCNWWNTSRPGSRVIDTLYAPRSRESALYIILLYRAAQILTWPYREADPNESAVYSGLLRKPRSRPC